MAGIRFFEQSYADIDRDTITLTLSNNSTNQDYLINRDPFAIWESIGSANDADPVIFEVDFGLNRTIDTLILNNTNLKNFTLEYNNVSNVWVTLLTETANTDTTYYATFSSITTDKVRLTMNGTMVANSEKTIEDFIITASIGQLVGYPMLQIIHSNNGINKQMVNGKSKVVINGFSRDFDLSFKDHVGTNDRALLKTLFNLREPFIIWPCGGDADQFAYPDEGWRLEDIYLVVIPEGYSHQFSKNLYGSGMNVTLKMTEAA